MEKPEPIIAVIFGGAGFIGKHLVSELQQANYNLHIADLIDPALPNTTFHSCDVRKPIQICVPNTPSVIFDLSAVHRTPGHDLDEYYDTNVVGAINIIQWAELMKCSRILFTSSIAVYGPGSEVKDENSLPEPIHAYGKSKLIAEEIFRVWQQKDYSSRKLVISRPAVIFGEGERGNFSRMGRAMSKNRFVIPGNKDVVKSSGYVKDLVRSMIFALGYYENFVLYNFAFPEEYSIKRISHSMAAIGGFKTPKNVNLKYLVPLLLKSKALNQVGQRIEKLLLPTRIAPRFLQEKGFKWNYDLENSLDEWFRQTQFDQKGDR